MSEETRTILSGHVSGCGCSGCIGGVQTDITGAQAESLADQVSLAGAVSALPFRLEDYEGATYRTKEIFTLDQVIKQIDAGPELSGKTLTYTFLEKDHTVGVYNNKNFGFPEPDGMSNFSEAQKQVAREGMQLWDDLIPQNIVETKAMGADIVFANTDTGPAQAWAYYPGKGYNYQSDIWTATPAANWTNDWLGYNGYGRTTLIHEAGHALGLSHPGEYNYSDDNDGDGVADPITYLGDAQYAQDSEQFSIMSYFAPRETGIQPVDVRLGLIGNAQTPMIHDIATIQHKYGADLTTRADDTVYFSNSTADRDVYDLQVNPFPFLAVYDAGGNDTFDFSDANMGVFIDLRAGSFSSATIGSPTLESANAATEAFNAATDAVQGDFALWVDQAEVDGYAAFIGSLGASRVARDTGVAGVNATSHGNVSIAYNTVIENAIGGSGRDYLLGNEAANRLTGNAGNDVLDGLEGDDTLVGGAGADEFRFTVAGGTDRVADFQSGSDKLNFRELFNNPATPQDDQIAFVSAFTKVAGQAVLSYDAATNTSTFKFDLNGDGKSDFALLINGQSVASDWIL